MTSEVEFKKIITTTAADRSEQVTVDSEQKAEDTSLFETNLSTASTSSEMVVQEKKQDTISVPIGRTSENSAGMSVDEYIDEQEMKTGSPSPTSGKSFKSSHIKYSKEDLEAARRAIERHAQELGIDFNSLSREEKIMYLGLAIAQKQGKITKEEFIKLVDEFVSDEIAAEIKENISEETDNIDDEKLDRIRKIINYHSRMRSAMSFVPLNDIYGANSVETRRLREEYLTKIARGAENSHKKIMEKVGRALPEKCSEKVAKTVLEATQNYVSSQAENIVSFVKQNGYSSNFVNSIVEITSNIVSKAAEITSKFVEKFFESPKGKAIKAYSKRMAEKFKSQKEECKELAADAMEKNEEAKQALKESQKAQDTANEMKKKAENIVASKGYKYLTDEALEETLKKESTLAYMQYTWAKEDEKKAYWKAYDAQSAKRLADAFLRIAQQTLAATKTMFFCAISKFMNS